MANKIVAVLGANGKLGQLVCSKILSLKQDKVLVKAIIRKGGAARDLDLLVKEFSTAKIQVVPVNYSSQKEIEEAFKGAFSVVSCVVGLDDIIIDLQSRLLQAAIDQKVRRFIPSDFSGDFTKIPLETNRNFARRTLFHREADKIMAAKSEVHKIEFTSIFQGGFTELIPEFQVLDFKNSTFNYFENGKVKQEFTTWADTALYSK